MIAVFYCEDASPYTMLTLHVSPVCSENSRLLVKSLIDAEFLLPTAEVLFIENDEVVNSYYLDNSDKEYYNLHYEI